MAPRRIPKRFFKYSIPVPTLSRYIRITRPEVCVNRNDRARKSCLCILANVCLLKSLVATFRVGVDVSKGRGYILFREMWIACVDELICRGVTPGSLFAFPRKPAGSKRLPVGRTPSQFTVQLFILIPPSSINKNPRPLGPGVFLPMAYGLRSMASFNTCLRRRPFRPCRRASRAFCPSSRADPRPTLQW